MVQFLSENRWLLQPIVGAVIAATIQYFARPTITRPESVVVLSVGAFFWLAIYCYLWLGIVGPLGELDLKRAEDKTLRDRIEEARATIGALGGKRLVETEHKRRGPASMASQLTAKVSELARVAIGTEPREGRFVVIDCDEYSMTDETQKDLDAVSKQIGICRDLVDGWERGDRDQRQISLVLAVSAPLVVLLGMLVQVATESMHYPSIITTVIWSVGSVGVGAYVSWLLALSISRTREWAAKIMTLRMLTISDIIKRVEKAAKEGEW